MRIAVNFKSLCSNYKSLIYSGISNISKNKSIKDNIAEYVKYQNVYQVMTKSGYMLHGYIKMDKNVFHWLNSVHKLQPKQFHLKKPLVFENFLSEHEKQLEFAHKIYPIVERIDFQKDKVSLNHFVKQYQDYLLISKENSKSMVVPSLSADFVWHSHMQDHDNYIRDNIGYFGKILDHRTDINVKKLTDQSTDSNNMTAVVSMMALPLIYQATLNHDDNTEKKDNQPNNTGSSCATVISSPPGGCGGSICSSSSCGGASCGGGGCGGCGS